MHEEYRNQQATACNNYIDQKLQDRQDKHLSKGKQECNSKRAKPYLVIASAV